MKQKFFQSLFFGLIFLIMSTVFIRQFKIQPVLSADESAVLSVKGNSRQGCVLFVSVKNIPDSVSAVCTWIDKEYQMVPNKTGLGAILPIPLDAKPGKQTLSVRLESPNGDSLPAFSRTVKIEKASRGVQHLWLSQKQLNKYSDPQADKDDEDIYNAISEYSTGISWKGNFIMPCRGGITTGFGLKRYYNNDPEPAFHKGLDIAAGYGVAVLAPQNGIVRFAKHNLVLHGTCCVIDHGNGIATLYLHMSSLKVKTGEEVKKGQIVGAVGSSGAASGPHLHWGAYAHGAAVDPYILFDLPEEWKE